MAVGEFISILRYAIVTGGVVAMVCYIGLSFGSPGEFLRVHSTERPKWYLAAFLVLAFVGLWYTSYSAVHGALSWLPNWWRVTDDDGGAYAVYGLLAFFGAIATIAGLNKTASERVRLARVLAERTTLQSILKSEIGALLLSDPEELPEKTRDLVKSFDDRMSRGEIAEDHVTALRLLVDGISRCSTIARANDRRLHEAHEKSRHEEEKARAQAAVTETWRRARAERKRTIAVISQDTNDPLETHCLECALDQEVYLPRIHELQKTVGAEIKTLSEEATKSPQDLGAVIAKIDGVTLLPGVHFAFTYQQISNGGIPNLYSVLPDGTTAPLTAGVSARKDLIGWTSAFFLDYVLPRQITWWHGLYVYGWDLLHTDEQLLHVLRDREGYEPEDAALSEVLEVPTGLRVVVSGETASVTCLAYMPNDGVSEKVLSLDSGGLVVSRESRLILKTRVTLFY
jgi:hypothetical protein